MTKVLVRLIVIFVIIFHGGINYMKNLLKLFILLLIFGFLFIILLNTFASNSEMKSVTDRINPFVKEKVSYVKTKNPDQTLEFGRQSYTQVAVDKKGNESKVTFETPRKLKTNRFLAISHKGSYVKTYKEVTENKVPIEAIKKLKSS